MLSDLAVILVKPRFPENIGMVARACANMGCGRLLLVNPERWDFLKAEPLATSQGAKLLANIEIYPDLETALAGFNSVWATTARLGARRGRPLSADAAAAAIADLTGNKIALVFGPEDRGLSNEELNLCQHLIHIPVEKEANSLNLAQAVLIVLYECRKAASARQKAPRASPYITVRQWHLLCENFRQALIKLDCMGGMNPHYYFRQWRSILKNGELTRREYDTLMGLCRQILRKK